MRRSLIKHKVLVFNAKKILIAICKSSTEAAKLTNSRSQSIYQVCIGTLVATNQMYFRYLIDPLSVKIEDIGVLTVEAYDQMCGVTRKVYKTAEMHQLINK